jgi:hypothetical protein
MIALMSRQRLFSLGSVVIAELAGAGLDATTGVLCGDRAVTLTLIENISRLANARCRTRAKFAKAAEGKTRHKSSVLGQ